MDPFFKYFDRYRTSKEAFEKNAYPEFKAKPIGLSKTIPLPATKIKRKNSDLVTMLKTRRSADIPFKGGRITALQDLSNLLSLSAGANQINEGRTYPSGGAKYPVGVYLVVYKVERVAPGLYFYNHQMNGLKEIRPDINLDLSAVKNNLHSDYKEANFIVLFSFMKNRSYKKYGSLAYKSGLLEGGHIAQNFLLAGNLLKLRSRPSLTLDFDYFNKLFNLDSAMENFFYAVVFGN